MNLFTFLSLVGLACYGWLIAVVVRNGLRQAGTAQWLFLANLVFLVVWQATALAVSLSATATAFLTWYTILTAVALGQFVLYCAFVRAFLGVRDHQWTIWVGVLWWIVSVVLIIAVPKQAIIGIYWRPESAIYLPELGTLLIVIGVPSYIFLGYAIALLFSGWRTSSSAQERTRILYLGIGQGLVVFGLLASLSDLLSPYPINALANIFNALLIAYAILRYKLLDISWVIRKGLVYSSLTLAITIVYFLVVSLAINILHVVTDYEIFFLTLFMAALTAVAILPLRDRVQGWVDRRFFREKYNWSAMLQRLSRTVASVLDLRRVTEMILNDVLQTMHIGSGAFLVRRDEDGTYRVQTYKGDAPIPQNLSLFRADSPVVSWLSRYQTSLSSRVLDTDPNFIGLWARERDDIRRIKAELFVPLLVRRQLIGILVLGPKLSEMPYSFEEQQILDTLANQTAVAIENASLFSATAAEQERTATIVEQAFAGIILLDSNLRISGLNPAAEAIIGLPAEQVTGQPLSDVLGPRIAGEGSSLNQAMLTGQRVAPREETLMCSERPCDVLLGVAPLRDGFLLSLADITQLKEAEKRAAMQNEQLRELNEQLKEADKRKSEFLSTVSHELRTPLTPIKQFLQSMLMGVYGSISDQQRSRLHIALDNVNDESMLIDNLLDLVRIEEGRVPLNRQIEDVGSIIRSVAQVLEHDADEKGIQLHTRTSEEHQLLAYLDRAKVKQILSNIVHNAIKFTPAGGSIAIQATGNSDNICIDVSDTGIGIPECELERIFERFYRVENSLTSTSGGTGIGLSIAKKYAELHGGRISVVSSPTSGSTFTVILPKQPGDQNDEPNENPLRR